MSWFEDRVGYLLPSGAPMCGCRCWKWFMRCLTWRVRVSKSSRDSHQDGDITRFERWKSLFDTGNENHLAQGP